MREKILVVDDEQEIADLVALYLQGESFEVFSFYSAAEALECIRRESLDLAILDVMMPEMDGFQLCRIIREQYTYPVIMLTAKGEEIDKITGLTLGADDYITKPFNPLELVARVKSQLRRYTVFNDFTPPEAKPNILKTGGLVLDTDTKVLTVDGEPVKITPMEYKILELLMRNQGRVFSIEQIYENAWNEPSFAPENTVAVHIRRIREKIEINPKEPKYLKVVWGIGYKIEKI